MLDEVMAAYEQLVASMNGRKVSLKMRRLEDGDVQLKFRYPKQQLMSYLSRLELPMQLILHNMVYMQEVRLLNDLSLMHQEPDDVSDATVVSAVASVVLDMLIIARNESADLHDNYDSTYEYFQMMHLSPWETFKELEGAATAYRLLKIYRDDPVNFMNAICSYIPAGR